MKHDRMLYGLGIDQYHREMIAQAQHERLVNELKQNSSKNNSNIRTAVTLIIQSLTK